MADQLRGPAAVGCGDHPLGGPECLQRHEAVVLVPGREVHRAAARVVIHELRVAHRPQQLDPALEAESADALTQPGLLLPLARDLERERAVPGERRRLDQQVEPLQRVQPRHGEDVIAVRVRAVGSFGRRRIEQVARDSAEPLQAALDRA